MAAVSSLGGRGLDIVRTICSEWGVTEDGNAVTVWADLPRSAMALTGAVTSLLRVT